MLTSNELIMAIDQGSTGTKVLVIDQQGEVLASSYRRIAVIYAQPGWVEHDPEDIWQSVIGCLREIASTLSLDRVAAIGITNQRETTIIWDRGTGEPVFNAISWQCRRSADISQRWTNAGLGGEIQFKTGAILDAYYSATKIAWLMENRPGLREQAERGKLCFGTVDTWLIWKLTGGSSHVTDSSNAVRTIMYNFRDAKWDQELLQKMHIPSGILPKVLPSNGYFGDAVEPGEIIQAPIPIRACLGDQQSALFGHACYTSGMAKCSFGTCLNLGMNIGPEVMPSPGGLNPTIAWNIDGKLTYKVEGGIFVGGLLLDWLQSNMRMASSPTELTAMAQSVDSAEGVYFVPAFVGLSAPYWDMFARGTIVGLTAAHDRRHIVRAAFESLGLQLSDVLGAMKKDFRIRPQVIRADGGVAKNDFVMQLTADITGVRIERPDSLERTSLGAAYLAGLSIGLWHDLGQVSQLWRLDRAFAPRMPEPGRAQLLENWDHAVDRAKGWIRPTSGGIVRE